jgi:hypothetical protein
MMDYSDRVRIAAMQELMRQGQLSAEDIAKRAEVFVQAMVKERNAQPDEMNKEYFLQVKGL